MLERNNVTPKLDLGTAICHEYHKKDDDGSRYTRRRYYLALTKLTRVCFLPLRLLCYRLCSLFRFP